MLRAIGILAGLLATAGVSVALTLLVSATGRYQLAVELELDGHRYVGKTVWEMSIWAAPELLPAPATPDIKVIGDAIDIPLPDGNTLFVLKRDALGPPAEGYGYEYRVCLPGKSIREDAASLPTYEGSCELDLHPKIALADPQGNLLEVPYVSQSDGQGNRARILSVIATGTKAPLTTGILERHPWIARLPSSKPHAPHTTPFYLEDFHRR